MKSKILAIAAVALSIAGCSPKIVQVAVHDTVTVTRTQVLRDTIVSVQLPDESRIIETRDTSSVLETSLAVSEASISGGVLHHSLSNRQTALQTPVSICEVEKVVYKSKEIPVEVRVPEPFVPRWVWYVLSWAILSTALTAVIIYLKLRK